MPQQYRTLRVWISNTVDDQAWQGNGLNVDAFDFTPAMEASYRVKIEGRLLDDDEQTGANKTDAEKTASEAKTTDENGADKMEEDAPAKEAKTEPQTHKFSHFFRSISVEFDRSRFRNGTEQTVEWKKSEPNTRNANAGAQADAAEFDEFTFKRNGDENINITVNLFRQQIPERYQLSPELADVVDMTEATQQEAVMALWEYIRASGLQEDEEKRNFRCDEPLRKVRVLMLRLAGIFITRTNLILGCWKRRCRVHSHAQRVCYRSRAASPTCQSAVHHPRR